MATDLKQDRNVDADMERAFGVGPRASATPVRPTGTPKPPSPVMPAAPRPPRRWLLIAAPALVALFVLGLAVHFALTLVPDNSTAPAAPSATPKAYSASAPAPAPTATAAAATPILPPDDFGPAPIDTPPAAPPTPLPPSPRARPARVAPAPRAAVDCPPGSHEDRCIFADVLAADRRLRGAYARATRAGVPTDDMVAIRRRWTRARAISLKSPDETIRRYEDLADALDDLVETEQR